MTTPRRITLYQFAPGLGGIQLSPPCLKVATYLRLRRLPYVSDDTGNVFIGAARMLPVVDIDGVRVGDSQAIIEHFESLGHGLDEGLDAAERAARQSVRRICDGALYFAVGHDRWQYGHDAIREHWVEAYAPRASLRAPARPVVRRLVVRGAQRTFRRYTGNGTYAPSLLTRWASQDIEALSATLGDRRFFLGARATTADAIAFALLDNVLGVRIAGRLVELMRAHPNLVAYHARLRAELFSEFGA